MFWCVNLCCARLCVPTYDCRFRRFRKLWGNEGICTRNGGSRNENAGVSVVTVSPADSRILMMWLLLGVGLWTGLGLNQGKTRRKNTAEVIEIVVGGVIGLVA